MYTLARGETMYEDEGLTELQHQAISLLMLGKGPKVICDQLDIERATLWAWRKLPKFQAAVAAEITANRENARAQVTNLTESAVHALALLISSADNEVVKLNAIKLVLEVTGVIGEGANAGIYKPAPAAVPEAITPEARDTTAEELARMSREMREQAKKEREARAS